VIWTACPAIVTFPNRAAPVLDVTETLADPGPLIPGVTTSHELLDEVVQAHPVAVVTFTVVEVAVAPKFTTLVESV